ncbi:hypothetical protein MBANPS3_005021 [Mucor bainieri]
MRKAAPSSSTSNNNKKGFAAAAPFSSSTAATGHAPPPPLPEKPKSIISESMDTNNNALGLDVPILPSTSTFTLSSGGKDDKPEKLKKKAKNFLDERQKIKSRAQSLWSFIDATNTFDQARFFQEHAEQVFQVVFETCIHQIEKIKHKSERPTSWNSKELVNLQKTLLLLRKIFLYVPELMRNGWQRHNIAIILTYVLDHGNHPRLRALGFQLLLLWLNDQVVEYPECMNLFANAISLDLFVLDEIQYYSSSSSSSNNASNSSTTHTTPIIPAPMHATTHLTSPTNMQDVEEPAASHKLHSSGLQFVKKLRESHTASAADKQINHGLQRDDKIRASPIELRQRLILGDDTQPLFPNPVQPTFSDSIALIHIFLANLVRLAFVAAGSPPPPDEYDYPPGDHFEPDDGIATGVGIDAATASAKFLFKIFKTHYMTKFVPLISRSLHVEGTSKAGVCGFPSCPPSILRSLLRFLIGYCLDNNSLQSSSSSSAHWPHMSHTPQAAAAAAASPATPILKSIVLSSHETREMLHEIIRQSLILPCSNAQYRDITRGAIHILGVWILGSEEERPSFLRRSGGINNNNNASSSSAVTRSSSTASVSNSTDNASILSSSRVMSTSPISEEPPLPPLPQPASAPAKTASEEEYSDANTFLRRYLLMIKLIFEDRAPRKNSSGGSGSGSRDMMVANVQQVTDWEGLVALYKDAINVYRAIAVSKGGIEIEWESWELLLQCLLDIQQWFMSQPEKYSRIPVQSLAEELADYIWETLLHAFIRAKITHTELWHNLKIHMVSSMRWVQALNQWVRIMQKLTRLLSSRLYKVEYELYPDTKYRLIEEFPSSANSNTSSSNRYSTHFNSSSNNIFNSATSNNTATTTTATTGGRALSAVVGGNPRVKVRSRHLSMQGNPRHGGGKGGGAGAGSSSLKRGTSLARRPLSACGTEGHLLTDMKTPEKQQHADTHEQPIPEGSVSTILRNLSSASLSDIANTFKTDRKSTNLTASVVDEEGEDEDHEGGGGGTRHSNIKFGIKKGIIPSASFSNTPSSSIHSASNIQPSSTSIGKRSNTNNSGNSLTGGGNSISGGGGGSGTNLGAGQSGNTASAANGSAGGNSGAGEKSVGRRAISIQQLDTLWQDSGSKLLNFVHHGDMNASPQISSSKAAAGGGGGSRDDDKKGVIDWDHASGGSSIEEMSTKSNRTSSSSAWPAGETLSMMTSPASVTEKLPASLGAFKSSEFLVLSNLPYDGQQVLSIWKNMLLTIGNINQIEGPQNHAIAMHCVVEIWDTLRLVRAQQPYRDVAIPAMFEAAPWFFQATELPSAFDAGKAAAYGCLCRLMSQRPEETVPEGYFAAFYKCILKGLASNDTAIIQAIILNSERLFGSSLPGVHILIPSFIGAIEKLLLHDSPREIVPCNVRKSCIAILGSLVSISNHLSHVAIQTDQLNMAWVQGFHQDTSFSFADVKVWLKNVFIQLVNVGHVPQLEQDTDSHCMLLGALCALILDELLSCDTPQHDIVHECVLSLVNHLYWCNISIVNTVCDCLNTIAQVYKDKLDPEGILVQEILTRIIDSLNIHLKYYEKSAKGGRGFIVSKLFSCLLEWIMSIEPSILTETDLCQLVFDVIELALHVTLDSSNSSNDKLLPPYPPNTTNATATSTAHQNGSRSSPQNKMKEVSFKFKSSEKRPAFHQQEEVVGPDVPENDRGYVKESAEAVLLHLLHHFNNFAPPYGPATIHSTIIGPGVSQQDDDEYHQYQYFSFNDTTIVAFVELPQSPARQQAQARMIIRDLTGRYVWDTQLEPKLGPSETQVSMENKFVVRQDVCIQTLDNQVIGLVAPNKDGHRPQELQARQASQDPMGSLLETIGDLHPDCLLDPSLPLNVPSNETLLQTDMVGNLGSQLDDYLQKEAHNNQQQESDVQLWYAKMNMLRKKETEDGVLKRGESMQAHLMANFSSRKDFLPAFPNEAEKPHVPFQQSRLLMSHMGFIHYSQLKNGSFQMLNKTPALYRDLRGLDRKHGRETMKIGLIYVAHGQEDEQSILQNSRGSGKYNAFVNSLGWEIDIATHTGYLGGLERNLTNGTRASYYCSSSIEMIFHDVTKMPTDVSDPKQLKKKRHIGNDHVHIIWNEHDRDYKIDTIGGDFGNAQIIVTPLPDNLYSIQVYRDSKIPYFGPLFDRMIVSQPILGSLVRSTAIDAFRASVHTNLYSFYKCVYAQRSNDVKTITNRHRVANWSYEQFMERIFMPEEQV